MSTVLQCDQCGGNAGGANLPADHPTLLASVEFRPASLGGDKLQLPKLGDNNYGDFCSWRCFADWVKEVDAGFGNH